MLIVNARICAYVTPGHSGEKDDPQQNGEFHYLVLWRIFSWRVPLLRLLANFFSPLLEIFFGESISHLSFQKPIYDFLELGNMMKNIVFIWL
jgi:hypothetical protein